MSDPLRTSHYNTQNCTHCANSPTLTAACAAGVCAMELEDLREQVAARGESPWLGWAQAQAEIDDLKTSVIAFCGPYAAEYARNHGLPRNHLHPTHYDILAKAGARMDDFVRGEWPTPQQALARTRAIQAAARRKWEGRDGR